MSIAERGNALRGGFGLAFRDLVCDPACSGASHCLCREDCPYACLFEPVWPEAASRLGTLDLPRPFVFRPPLKGDPEFGPAQPMLFELRLFGQAIHSYEFFIRAFQNLSVRGLGQARIPFDLMSVASVDWSEGVSALIQRDGHLTGASPVLLDFRACASQEDRSGRITIEFATPTLVKENGVELRVPTLPAMVKRLRDRISHLCLAYERIQWEVDYGGIGELASCSSIAAVKGEWEDRSRVSSRTGQRTPLSGFCGYVTYKDFDPRITPLLLIGQEIHLGRHAAWGNGWFRLRDASDKR
jgi:CRISPR-associated endoribonuclease Cas6